MASADLYENDSEHKLHSRAIWMLARDVNIPEVEIQILCEKAFSRLREKARIKDYLVVLASRSVKELIKDVGSEKS